MNPWLWWMCGMSLWTEAALAPFAGAGVAERPTEAQVEYMVAELRADLDTTGARGIIDEGGRG